jgi:hypothetical protein
MTWRMIVKPTKSNSTLHLVCASDPAGGLHSIGTRWARHLPTITQHKLNPLLLPCFVIPTVQAACIPLALAGRDICQQQPNTNTIRHCCLVLCFRPCRWPAFHWQSLGATSANNNSTQTQSATVALFCASDRAGGLHSIGSRWARHLPTITQHKLNPLLLPCLCL